MSQFSSHENVSLEKTVEIDLQPKKHDISCLETLYEIDKCSIWIQKHNFQNVCLQFPSHMLPDAAEVALQIEKNVGNCVYIIGDSSYEGCCIDYVAAEHINSDAIIHYGYSCFSQLEDRIPVLTILEKKQVDLVELFTLLNAQFHENVCVICDKPYVSLIDGLIKNKEANVDLYKNIIIVKIQDYNNTYTSGATLFITHGERAVRNLHNHYKIENLFYFDPENDKIQFEKFAETNAAYKRRFFLMEAIKDAQTIGIVVATMSVKNYLEIINRMKKLCKLHNKKSYILSVGKPNIAKFANFPEIDIFVIIACPQNNIYDSRDFYKPVVAPFDVELALNPNRTEHFNVHNFYDYNEILSEDKYPLPDKLSESDSVDISLISGKVRRLNTKTDTADDGAGSETDLIVRDKMQVVLNDSHGAGYLFARSWKGLEQKLGEDQPKVAEVGRKGIASKYENEAS